MHIPPMETAPGGYQPLSKKQRDTREICQKAISTPAGGYLINKMLKAGQIGEFIRLVSEKPRFTVRTVNGHEITETVNRKTEWEARRLLDIDNQQGAKA